MRVSRQPARELICQFRVTEELRNRGSVTKTRNAQLPTGPFVEDCAESFLVVAQTPAVPARKLRDLGFP